MRVRPCRRTANKGGVAAAAAAARMATRGFAGIGPRCEVDADGDARRVGGVRPGCLGVSARTCPSRQVWSTRGGRPASTGAPAETHAEVLCGCRTIPDIERWAPGDPDDRCSPAPRHVAAVLFQTHRDDGPRRCDACTRGGDERTRGVGSGAGGAGRGRRGGPCGHGGRSGAASPRAGPYAVGRGDHGAGEAGSSCGGQARVAVRRPQARRIVGERRLHVPLQPRGPDPLLAPDGARQAAARRGRVSSARFAGKLAACCPPRCSP